ncbi:cytochrome P450 [Leucobacter allii]|uniref:cytochrome P450 n=1 Tax=Leucobacter allii TaxID=2932247 RepID=UPI001FD51336|nr:cytochrome P450 [Leucobacter allii]UOR00545.1 cytochrome P450 [Leucobacter allii]
MTAQPAPVADWVTIPDLVRDPFPIYERLRAEGGVHWVPAVGRTLITSYAAVHETELDQETFSANEEGSLQIRAMGHSMLRRDDPEHYIERKAWQPALRPGEVKRTWTRVFERNAARALDALAERGPGSDLIWDFAAPYAAENLRELIGFHNADQSDLQRWSQTMIDATGNYADDPEVWALGKASFDEVDAALDEMLAWHAAHLDDNPTLIAQLLRAPERTMPLERIRANLKMTIGGGLNEPRDALGVAAWALLQHPEQRAAVAADPELWPAVFEEAIRWVAPIGLYSRQVTRDTELAGVALPAGAKLGICVLSANRDETVWAAPERFDIHREVRPHLAFGKGTHVCLGAWVAKAEVAAVGLPRLFSRFEGLALSETDPAVIAGWVFRGMTRLPVTWERARPAADGNPSVRATATAPRITIVGSGPSGSFTAQAVRKAIPDARIDVVEAQPVPYGLVRYGVAADHQGTKSVSRQFDRLYAEPGVRFIGNTRLGVDVSLDELRAASDAVVLATGVRGDAPLRIPGGDLAGVHGAGAITRTLNGHPDAPAPPALGARVAIVGHGNVAMDVARLLTRRDFTGSDLDDAVHADLAGAVRTVHLIGRSAPELAKFDPVMVRELAGLPGVRHVVHGVDLDAVPEGKDARLDAVRELAAADPGERGSDGEPGTPVIEWWFGARPVEISGERGVRAIRIAQAGADRELAVTAVVTAVGFVDEGAEASGSTAMPTSAGAHPDGRVEPGLYTAGWLRRGPRGTIPEQREDARQLARMIRDDLAARDGDAPSAAGIVPPVHAVDFAGWRRIDLRERLGAAPGRVRAKLASRDAQLAAARDASLVPPPAPGRAAGARHEGAITILFATESGGAELAAEELRRHLDGGDVRLLDVADAAPEELDPQRLHLVLCSSYGDGELPTAARGFHAELRAARGGLAGLRYAVFGLGDRSYAKTYSRGSELLDEALTACGAQRIGEYGRHDAGGGTDAAEAAVDWLEGVLAELADAAPVAAGLR